MRSLTSTLTNTPPELDPLPQTGSLAEVPIIGLLRALRGRQSTGALTLQASCFPRTVVYLMDGDLVAASPELEDRRLARYFYRQGLITRAQLEAALEKVTADEHLGDVLVNDRILPDSARDEALTLLFKGVLFSCLALRDGTFAYQPLEAIFAYNLQLFLDSEALLAEGTRLLEEAAILCRELEREDHVYQRVTSRSQLALPLDLEALLGRIDGRRSTAELFVLSPLERLPTIHQLSKLLEHGLIRKVRAQERRLPEAIPTFPLLPEEMEPLSETTELEPAPSEPPRRAEAVLEEALAQAAFAPVTPELEPPRPSEGTDTVGLRALEEVLHREPAGPLVPSATPDEELDPATVGTDETLREKEEQLERALAESPANEHLEARATVSEEPALDANATPLPDVFQSVSDRMSGRRPFGDRASHPDEGVFLSANTVLDVVDLTHVHQFGVATDIPLDGIVETMGAEDDEHHMAALAADEDDYHEEDEAEEEELESITEEMEDAPAEVRADAAGMDLEALSADEPPARMDLPEHDGPLEVDLEEDHDDDYESLRPGDIVDDGGPLSWDAEYVEPEQAGEAPALGPAEGLEAAVAPDHGEEDFEELRPEDVADIVPQEEEPEPLDEPLFPPQQALYEPPPPRDELGVEPTVEELAEITVEGALSSEEDVDELEDVASARTVSIRATNALLPPLKGLDEAPMLSLLATETTESRLPLEERISEREMEVLARIDGIFQHRPSTAVLGAPRRRRVSEMPPLSTPQKLSTPQRALLRERAEIYNHIFSSIFSAISRQLGREKTRLRFQELLKPGTTTYAELFLEANIRPDGSIDPEIILRNLDAYPTPRPVETFDASLNELLSFLLNDVYETVEPWEQMPLMDSIVKLRNLLYKRALAAG